MDLIAGFILNKKPLISKKLSPIHFLILLN